MNRATGTVFERSGSWAYRVHWRENGARRSKRGQGYATRAEAQHALTAVLGEIYAGRMVTPQGTVAEYMREWFDTYQRSGKVKHTTAVAVRDHVEAHIVPRLGDIPLAKLSPQHVAKFYADLLTGGEVRHKTRRALSPKSVRNIAQTLRKALADGVKYGRVGRNVADLVDLPRWERRELTVWDTNQIGAFLRHADETGDYLAPVWLLMFTTGMRRGEACGLQWSDIDLVEGTATIRQTRLDVRRQTITETPKTRKSRRTVSLDSGTVLALAHLKNTQEAAAQTLGGWAGDLVVTNLDGAPISPDALTRRFAQAVKAAGLPPMRLHDVRHSSATLQLGQGVPVHVVAGRLGHSTPATTLNVYAAYLPRADKLAADVVGGALAAFMGANVGANLPRVTETSHPHPTENP